MAAYAIKLFREVRGLTPSPSTKEIISKLARHFNEEIRSTISGRPINTLEDLLELLERFDNAGPLNSYRTPPRSTQESWRNRGTPGVQQYTRNNGDRGYQPIRNLETGGREPRNDSWRRPERNLESPKTQVRVLNLANEEEESSLEEGNTLEPTGN